MNKDNPAIDYGKALTILKMGLDKANKDASNKSDEPLERMMKGYTTLRVFAEEALKIMELDQKDDIPSDMFGGKGETSYH